MSSLWVIIIPVALIALGILLNSFHIVHDQPEFSSEEDPIRKLAAERQANYQFFKHQRARLLTRQNRVGRYGWLVLAVSVASSWFLYSDAVRTTTASKQISAIQTFAVADSKDAVLSVTLSDGSNVKYVVKSEPSVDRVRNLAELGTGELGDRDQRRRCHRAPGNRSENCELNPNSRFVGCDEHAVCPERRSGR